jgi:hypothetical protein
VSELPPDPDLDDLPDEIEQAEGFDAIYPGPRRPDCDPKGH